MPITIPVTGAGTGDRRIQVNTGDAHYWFRIYYSEGQEDGWFLDIADIAGRPLLVGKRIAPGAPNLLKGHGNAFRGAQLAAVVLSGEARDPGVPGAGINLVWYGAGERNDHVLGDPLVDIAPDDWQFGERGAP